MNDLPHAETALRAIGFTHAQQVKPGLPARQRHPQHPPTRSRPPWDWQPQSGQHPAGVRDLTPLHQEHPVPGCARTRLLLPPLAV